MRKGAQDSGRVRLVGEMGAGRVEQFLHCCATGPRGCLISGEDRARMRLWRWIGARAISAMTAAQFGLAMMPGWVAIAAAFISGRTSGTAGSMRKAEELSMTTAPSRTANGAYSRATPLPAENRARSTPAKPRCDSVSTAIPNPAKGRALPAELGEAKRRNFASGNRGASRTRNHSRPTAPVAPTIATVRGKWCERDAGQGVDRLASMQRHLCRGDGRRNKKAPSVAGEASVVELPLNSAHPHLRHPTEGCLQRLALEHGLHHRPEFNA